jgi:2-keto-3-deoxy-6-phosphogluconate aldolase
VESVRPVVSLREQEIREMVATQHFDLAVLVLNNIVYTGAKGAEIAVRISRGLELVRTLREQYQLPVFVLVGSGHDLGAVERSLEAGASFAVRIPCDTNILVAAIAKHVRLA